MDQFYVGTKIIEGGEEEKDGAPGYAVKYEGGYTSWSPKDVFERAYLPMGSYKGAPNNNRVTEEMVDDFVAEYHVEKMGDKTTVVVATLKNGFIIAEFSSCVGPANYHQGLGMDICIARIKNKVWELLGFLVQTGVAGVKPTPAADAEVADTPDTPDTPDTAIEETQVDDAPDEEAVAASGGVEGNEADGEGNVGCTGGGCPTS